MTHLAASASGNYRPSRLRFRRLRIPSRKGACSAPNSACARISDASSSTPTPRSTSQLMRSDADAFLGKGPSVRVAIRARRSSDRVTEVRSGIAKVIPLAYPLVAHFQDSVCEESRYAFTPVHNAPGIQLHRVVGPLVQIPSRMKTANSQGRWSCDFQDTRSYITVTALLVIDVALKAQRQCHAGESANVSSDNFRVTATVSETLSGLILCSEEAGPCMCLIEQASSWVRYHRSRSPLKITAWRWAKLCCPVWYRP